MLSSITKSISIDKVEGNTVFAYSNYHEYQALQKYGIQIKLLRKPGDVDYVEMSSNSKDLKNNWNTYPTYTAYVDMMYQFQND